MKITKKKLKEWNEIKDDIEDEDIEYVKCEVKVPIQIVEFLGVFNIDVQKWVEEGIIDHFGANLDCFFTDPTIFMDGLQEKFKNIPHLARIVNFAVKNGGKS